MTSRFCRFLINAAGLLAIIIPAAAAAQQQRAADTALHYVANTRPPDAFLALRSQPTSASGVRLAAMPNGTALRVLERRGDGWWRVRIETSGQEGWALAAQGSRTWIECCMTATVTSPPAADPELIGFKTPSSNIHCQYFEGESDKGTPIRTVRCDIRDVANRPPPRPRDCELEWGQAFEVGAEAMPAERLCYGDTIMDPKLATLAYGQAWERNGFRCKSDQSGVTCVNPTGHGFELSRSAQRVF
jgi:uncharacterized protein DUF6636/SH3 domain-containing protein